MAEKAKEILDAFPKDDDWYVAEKALRWLKEYKDTLLEALTMFYEQNSASPSSSKLVSQREITE